MTNSRKDIPEGLPESVHPETVKTPDPRDHYVELDALRGLAISGTVLAHFIGVWIHTLKLPTLSIPLLGGDVLPVFLAIGLWGLCAFFLLSGYLLIWTEEKRARRGIYSVRSYALRRALRLVPAYYVAILLVAITWTWQNTTVMDVLMHMSFLHTLNPYTATTLDPAFWSLSSEMVFYMLVPILVLKLPRLSQRLVLFGVLFFVALATQVYIVQHADQSVQPLLQYLRLLPTSYLYLFLAGVLLRMMVERLGDRPIPRLQPPLALALFLVSTSVWVLLPLLAPQVPMFPYPDPQTGLFQQPELWTYLLVFILGNGAVVAFFASVLLGAPLLRKALSWRPLAFIGMISYSMYLLHETILYLVFWPFLASIRGWVVGAGDLVAWAAFLGYYFTFLAAVVFVSYLSYRYIESPFLRHKPK